jgi:hypothetical protein
MMSDLRSESCLPRALGKPTSSALAQLLGLLTMLAWLFGGPGCSDSASLGGAGGEGDDYVYQNVLFPGSSLITAAASAGADPGRPSFSWQATGYRHVVCAVFDERISIIDGTIANPHRIRWLWNSGLPDGREGNVTFADGVSDPETDAAPITLENGTYYWAVWTLDASGSPAASTIENGLDIPLLPQAAQ